MNLYQSSVAKNTEIEAAPVGEVFSSLTVIANAAHHMNKLGRRNSVWRVQCVCGSVLDVISYYLKNGATKSCGCIKKPKKLKTGKKVKTEQIDEISEENWKAMRFLETLWYKKGNKND